MTFENIQYMYAYDFELGIANLSHANMTSLQGIEAYDYITTLDVSNNNLESLDEICKLKEG